MVLASTALLVLATAALANDGASSTETSSLASDRRPVFAGRGNGVSLSSGDGAFRLAIGLRAHLLYQVERGDATKHSLSLRRARVTLKGHAYGEHNRYMIQLAFAPKDLAVKDGSPQRTPIFDWFFTFDHLRDLSLRLGQYLVPFGRERRISAFSLQMVDRSLVNKAFTLDRDIGFDLHSNDLLGLSLFRYNLGIYVGDGMGSFELRDLGLLYVGRVEVLPFGLFHDRGVMRSERPEEPQLSIGAAYAYHDHKGTSDLEHLEADLLFRFLGVSLFSELFWRSSGPNAESGFTIQGGYRFVHPVEVVARYSEVKDGDRAVGGGVTYYFQDHYLKLQADGFRIWNDTNSTNRFRLQLEVML